MVEANELIVFHEYKNLFIVFQCHFENLQKHEHAIHKQSTRVSASEFNERKISILVKIKNHIELDVVTKASDLHTGVPGRFSSLIW